MRIRTLKFAAFLFVILSLVKTEAQKPASTAQPSKAPTASSALTSPQGKIDPAKEADIIRLLELTGAKGIMLQTMERMETNIKPMLMGTLPPGDYRDKLIDLFVAKLHAKADPNEVIALVVPVYDKHFSHEDIKGLIQFYQTPLGKKAVSVLPMVMTESMQAGQKWGEDLGRKCMQEVITEHPELEQAMEAAAKSR